jgi:hypothetical protein
MQSTPTSEKIAMASSQYCASTASHERNEPSILHTLRQTAADIHIPLHRLAELGP